MTNLRIAFYKARKHKEHETKLKTILSICALGKIILTDNDYVFNHYDFSHKAKMFSREVILHPMSVNIYVFICIHENER